MDFSTYGKYYANADGTNETMKLARCASASTCEDVYDAAVTGTEVIETVTIDGEAYELPAALQVAVNTDDGVGVYNAIMWALTQVEFDIWLQVTYAAGDLTVWHVGQATITNIITDGGTKVFARNCTLPFEAP